MHGRLNPQKLYRERDCFLHGHGKELFQSLFFGSPGFDPSDDLSSFPDQNEGVERSKRLELEKEKTKKLIRAFRTKLINMNKNLSKIKNVSKLLCVTFLLNHLQRKTSCKGMPTNSVT